MNKYFFLFLLLLFVVKGGYCQHVELKGKVEGLSGKEKLAGALVTCTGKDGVVRHVITDSDGEFQFKNMPAGTYIIRVEYVGFIIHESNLELSGERKTELNIQMSEKRSKLSTVQVYGKLS